MDRERGAGSIYLKDKVPDAPCGLGKARAIGDVGTSAWHQQPVERLEQRLDFGIRRIKMDGRRACPSALDELDV